MGKAKKVEAPPPPQENNQHPGEHGIAWTFHAGSHHATARVNGYTTEAIAFICDIPQAVTSSITLKATVHDRHRESKPHQYSTRVVLKASHVVGHHSIQYVGELHDPPPELLHLLSQEFHYDRAAEARSEPPPAEPAPAPEPRPAPVPVKKIEVVTTGIDPADKRRHRRIERHFRVVSRDLRHFRALTSDITTMGVKLVAEDPLEVGSFLDLDLDFDDFGFPRIKCRGSVRWCRQKDARSFLAGIYFEDLPEENRQIIERYISHVAMIPH